MTTRHIGYVVVLDRAIREDDAEATILTAIRLLRGVVSVEPVEESPGTQIAFNNARHQIEQALWKALQDARAE